MINPNLREELIDVAGDNDILNKVLDLCHNPIQITFGVHRKKLWGVETSNRSGIYTSRISGVILDSMVGEMMAYVTSSFKLKAIMTVFGGFSNSPDHQRGINSKNIHSFFVVKNIEVLHQNLLF